MLDDLSPSFYEENKNRKNAKLNHQNKIFKSLNDAKTTTTRSIQLKDSSRRSTTV